MIEERGEPAGGGKGAAAFFHDTRIGGTCCPARVWLVQVVKHAVP